MKFFYCASDELIIRIAAIFKHIILNVR